MNYWALEFARIIVIAFILTVIVVCLLIGFFATWHIELLYIAIFLGLIDFIIICAISKPLKDYIKYLYKGLKTGDWEQ